ncbi:MAG: S8 family serine peptidase [Steroidobacteraceae bacterium]
MRCLQGVALAMSLAIFLAAGQADAQGQNRDGRAARWVSGELLVGFRAGVGAPRRHGLYTKHGAEFLQDIGQRTRIVRIRVPAGTEDAVLSRLARQPEVKFVEKNLEFAPALTPNDPEYLGQWHLPQIGVEQAWDLSQGSAGAVIAILDSGIDATQPDFAGKLLLGYNTYSNNSDTGDAFGHGTEVAGVAGALTNNGVGVAGVAGNAPLMPVRVTDGAGAATTASIANGIIWATDHGARVINLSFEGVVGNATIAAAAQYAANHGALVVAASGNCGCVEGQTESPFILSVSATDETDALAYFSSTGSYVDLSAPGTYILTTAKYGLFLPDSGTSLASPVVAGVAALMFGANPALTPAAATELLEGTSVDLGNAGYDTDFGYGRVDALAAVTAAIDYQPPLDTKPPTVVITAPGSGANVSGTAVVDVAADDNVGVVKVDLLVDGVYYASDDSSPYSFAWDVSASANGAHTLQVVASDAAGNSGSSTVITVNVANNARHPPVASDDAFVVPVRARTVYAPQVLAVLANDSDIDGDLIPASVRIVRGPNRGGDVRVHANGTVSYVPRRGFSGVETFIYTVKDRRGAVSNRATAGVTVTNGKPSASAP